MSLDTNRRELKYKDEIIELTSKEYSLLKYLMLNHNKVLSRNDLAEHVWDSHFEPSSNVVDVYIGYLRQKLNTYFFSTPIKTVRGHGYILNVESEK